MENKQPTQLFACGAAEPPDPSPGTVGNKAAHLIRMAEAGLPVPPGFVITTDICREYFDRDCRLPDDFTARLAHDMESIERATGFGFGGGHRPLLVAVRSGAPVSMPGMMDTILNVGICDRTISPMIRMTGNPRFVWDSYRRFVQNFGEVVFGLPSDPFDQLISEKMHRESAYSIRELDGFALRELAQKFLDLFRNLTGQEFPQEPLSQLVSAVESVFQSWQSPRAREYRRLQGIEDHPGNSRHRSNDGVWEHGQYIRLGSRVYSGSGQRPKRTLSGFPLECSR
jgi:pyruvate,orthophosphate dikinase